MLEPEQIARILDAARSRYNIAPDAEISRWKQIPVPDNPGEVPGLPAAPGVNRLSMGVQVLDDRMLKKLGRIHTAQGALEFV